MSTDSHHPADPRRSAGDRCGSETVASRPEAPLGGAPSPRHLDHVWSELLRAAGSARHGWHLPVIATLDESGAPDARVVVLRRVDVESRRIVFHTDRRSPKCTQLTRVSGAVALVFYDGERREQLRVAGEASVEHDGPLVEAQWASGSDSSLRCYLAPQAPSSSARERTPNLPPDARDAIPPRPRLQEGRARFAVVSVRIDRLDWLHLAHDGHERIGWTFDAADDRRAEPIDTTWLAP